MYEQEIFSVSPHQMVAGGRQLSPIHAVAFEVETPRSPFPLLDGQIKSIFVLYGIDKRCDSATTLEF